MAICCRIGGLSLSPVSSVIQQIHEVKPVRTNKLCYLSQISFFSELHLPICRLRELDQMISMVLLALHFGNFAILWLQSPGPLGLPRNPKRVEPKC